ncbi:Cytochrome P450 monooxygenase sdnF [Lachnellula suecica]|uniref:Cytochrome P450 monooxygenase sdnF n=1 Tax=Lachnellula suecica TaxID=602035 RepID=A0A8T9C8W4_9HELO|nr:Cytochrome P450 monooxygenase sdnF [Lachnellula suecica]
MAEAATTNSSSGFSPFFDLFSGSSRFTKPSFARASVSVVAFAFFYVLASITYNLLFHPLRKVPGPLFHRATKIPWTRAWIAGNLHHSLLALHEQYGEVVRIAPNELSFISAAAFQQIYGTDSIARNPRLPALNGNQHDIMFWTNIADHTRFRKYLIHSLNGPSAISGHESVIQRNADVFRRQVEAQANANDRVVNMTNFYDWLTFDVAGDLLWRESFGSLEKLETHPWQELQGVAALGTYGVLIAQFPWLEKIMRALTPRKLLELMLDVVKEKQKTMLPNAGVASLASAKFPGLLSPNEVNANLVILVNAGGETTSTTLNAATYFLTRNKACARKAREEVRAAFASENDISHPKVTQLPYLNAVILETLRLAPVVPTSISRYAVREVLIDGAMVPKGTCIRTTNFAAGRYSTYFRDASEFRPERWLGHPSFESDNRAAIQPFLSGKHSCMGRKFAEMEMTHVLARLLWAYEFELVDDTFGFCEQRTNLLWEKGPLNVRMIPV